MKAKIVLLFVVGVLSTPNKVSAQGFLTLPLEIDSEVANGWHYKNTQKKHYAIDYYASLGQKVTAAADGVAITTESWTDARRVGSYGKMVLVRYNQTNSQDQNYMSIYAHLQKPADHILIKPKGKRWDTDYENWTPVRRGEVIGYAGESGTTWLHLHFETFVGNYDQKTGSQVDPYDLYTYTKDYPDCGLNRLWLTCPPQPWQEDPLKTDDDGDGYNEEQGDCDDTDERVYPAAQEYCDEKDNNCDGEIDEDFKDRGLVTDLGQPCTINPFGCESHGFVVCTPDGLTTICDVEAIRPADEICNGLDDDCDGQIDEEPEASQSCQDELDCTENYCDTNLPGCRNIYHHEWCADEDECTNDLCTFQGCVYIDDCGDADTDIDTDIDTDTDTDTGCSDPNTCYNQGCGQVCTSGDSDCPSSFSCLSYARQDSGFCTEVCDRVDDQCGCYWHCGYINESINMCLPGRKPCEADIDCGDTSQYVCGLSVEDVDNNGKIDSVISRCRERVEGGESVGADCGSSVKCYNDLCLGYMRDSEFQGTCYAFCRNDGDCPENYTCETLDISLALDHDVESVSIKVCVFEDEPCTRDEDCYNGQVCGIDMSTDTICVEPECDRGGPDCLDSGDECSAETDPCYNSSCFWSGGSYYCYEFCREGHNEDCDVAGQVCVGVNNNTFFLCMIE